METKDIVNKIMHSFNGTCCQEKKAIKLTKEKKFFSSIASDEIQKFLSVMEPSKIQEMQNV